MHYDIIYNFISLHRILQTSTRMMQSYFANAPLTISLTVNMNTKLTKKSHAGVVSL